MPIPKIDVVRDRCGDCGERTGVCNEDAFCYGCGRIVCPSCTEENEHISTGRHGPKV